MADEGSDGDDLTPAVFLSKNLEEQLRLIPTMLSYIPEAFKSKRFDTLRMVLAILSSPNPREAIQELESSIEMVDLTMKTVVNAYHEGFNKSVKSFNHILASVSDCQSRVDTLKSNVERSKGMFSCRAQETRLRWAKLLEYQHMLAILDKIDTVKEVGARLDDLVQKKEYLQAATLIVTASDLLLTDLLDISALSDLRQMIIDRKNDFHERLIEELQDHIYLRNNSVEAFSSTSSTITSTSSSSNSKPSEKEFKSLTSVPSSSSFFEYDDLTNEDLNELRVSISRRTYLTPVPSSTTSSPASLSSSSTGTGGVVGQGLDQEVKKKQASKEAMLTLIQSLKVLGQVSSAISTLTSQLQQEIHVVVDKTVAVIQQNSVSSPSPSPSSSSSSSSSGSSSQVSRQDSSSSSNNPLTEFLKLLSSRCIGILRSHLFVSQILEVEAPTRGKNVENYDIDMVWSIMQDEIRTLLRIHLEGSTSDGKMRPDGLPAELSLQDEQLELFVFGDSSAATYGSSEAPETHESSLFKPSAYNIISIYPLMSSFNDEVVTITGKETDATMQLHGFLHEYIKKTFLPRVRLDFARKLESCLEASDAFKPREQLRMFKSSALIWRWRVFKSTEQVLHFALVLISYMITMPRYTQEFLQVLKQLLTTYFDRTNRKYKTTIESTLLASMLSHTDLVNFLYQDPLWANLDSDIPSSPSPAHLPTVTEREKITSQHDTAASDKFYKREEFMEEKYISTDIFLSKDRLIFDVPKLTTLAILSHSLEWLSQKFSSLSELPSHLFQFPPGTAGLSYDTSSSSSSSAFNIDLEGVFSEDVYSFVGFRMRTQGDSLDIVRDTLKTFTTQFRDLYQRCLISLRLEYRLHCYHFLDGIKQASYWFETESSEPDSFIHDLNKDLATNEECISAYLPPQKTRYLFGGLAHLISSVLVKSLDKIDKINSNGVLKMCRNVFALQQNLTSIIVFQEVHFERVRKFYELLNSSEDELLGYIAEHISDQTLEFTLDELKSVFAKTNKKYPGNKLSLILEQLFKT